MAYKKSHYSFSYFPTKRYCLWNQRLLLRLFLQRSIKTNVELSRKLLAQIILFLPVESGLIRTLLNHIFTCTMSFSEVEWASINWSSLVRPLHLIVIQISSTSTEGLCKKNPLPTNFTDKNANLIINIKSNNQVND